MIKAAIRRRALPTSYSDSYRRDDGTYYHGILFPDGVLSGLSGIVLAVVGTLSFGPTFLFLAAIASIFSLVRSLVGRSGLGIFTAALSIIATSLGFFLCLVFWKAVYVMGGR